MLPNKALELTPLCGPKIVCILKVGIGPTAFPFYRCGAAQRQAVGPSTLSILEGVWKFLPVMLS
jgi:hypothetical protein